MEDLVMKTKVKILGCCISRDTFGMFDSDGGFDVTRCVTNSHLVSMCSPQLDTAYCCQETDFPESRHYFQR